MKQHVRRTATAAVLALAATTLTTLSTAVSTASAQPETRSGAHARAGAADLDCRVALVGVTSGRKLVQRRVFNNRVVFRASTATALPYDPTGLAYHGGSEADGRRTDRYAAVTTDGVPRLLTTTRRLTGDVLRHSSVRMLTRGFRPVLFAQAGGYQVYTVNGSGVLHRWFTYRDDDGKYFYGHRQTLGSGYGDLRSLAAIDRLRVDGVIADVLYATTRGGALKQLVIPVRGPWNERLRTVQASGYRGVTELSPGYCNDDSTHHVLIVVRPAANKASWTTLTNALQPRPANALRRGPVGVGLNWNLHAVI